MSAHNAPAEKKSELAASEKDGPVDEKASEKKADAPEVEKNVTAVDETLDPSKLHGVQSQPQNQLPLETDGKRRQREEEQLLLSSVWEFKPMTPPEMEEWVALCTDQTSTLKKCAPTRLNLGKGGLGKLKHVNTHAAVIVADEGGVGLPHFGGTAVLVQSGVEKKAGLLVINYNSKRVTSGGWHAVILTSLDPLQMEIVNFPTLRRASSYRIVQPLYKTSENVWARVQAEIKDLIADWIADKHKDRVYTDGEPVTASRAKASLPGAFVCKSPECGKSLKTAHWINKHMSNTHPNAQLTPYPEKDISSEIFLPDLSRKRGRADRTRTGSVAAAATKLQHRAKLEKSKSEKKSHKMSRKKSAAVSKKGRRSKTADAAASDMAGESPEDIGGVGGHPMRGADRDKKRKLADLEQVETRETLLTMGGQLARLELAATRAPSSDTNVVAAQGVDMTRAAEIFLSVQAPAMSAMRGLVAQSIAALAQHSQTPVAGQLAPAVAGPQEERAQEFAKIMQNYSHVQWQQFAWKDFCAQTPTELDDMLKDTNAKVCRPHMLALRRLHREQNSS